MARLTAQLENSNSEQQAQKREVRLATAAASGAISLSAQLHTTQLASGMPNPGLCVLALHFAQYP